MFSRSKKCNPFINLYPNQVDTFIFNIFLPKIFINVILFLKNCPETSTFL